MVSNEVNHEEEGVAYEQKTLQSIKSDIAYPFDDG
ncbi:hypothetical protein G714_04306 [Escherichia coli HVH 39 (4-2679949)]|nr:hypothetical protein G714_04306 [Escherichia coli HVH 39 (4-2679949)]